MIKRKGFSCLILMIFVVAFLVGCTKGELAIAMIPVSEQSELPENMEITTLQIQIGTEKFSAAFYNNTSCEALLEKLPLTLDMSELNGNEKYYYMDSALPQNSEKVGKIEAGELMLYGSDCLVLFYEDFSTSYSYTRLGKINNITGLKQAVGDGGVQVSIRLQESELDSLSSDILTNHIK